MFLYLLTFVAFIGLYSSPNSLVNFQLEHLQQDGLTPEYMVAINRFLALYFGGFVMILYIIFGMEQSESQNSLCCHMNESPDSSFVTGESSESITLEYLSGPSTVSGSSSSESGSSSSGSGSSSSGSGSSSSGSGSSSSSFHHSSPDRQQTPEYPYQ